ncbi:hypothetical protein GGH91_004809 [Coemansia sp. RSA 2671]|nr:hypothetical protein GGH91_004809 [Coemansia sp. RSA 2671]KAJ2698185.1 hypothetical protein H4218_003472 [Coemansia sp. IMI 209128]
MSGVQAFNCEQVQGCISKGWLDALDKLNDPAVNDKEKPSVHKDKAGGNGTSSKWKLNKTSTMANKKDFLDELRRQLKQKTQ